MGLRPGFLMANREAAAPEASAGASDEPARGLWNRFRPPDGGSIDPAAVQKLKSIGYLSGYSAAKRYENVTLYDPSASFNAPSLYTSGHAPEAFLIDMNGKVLHQWRYEYDRALPGHLGPSTPSGTQHWRFASVMPNGDLLAIFEGQGLIRLDRESKLLWSLPIGAHHRLAIAANGDIYVLTREIRQIDGVNSVDPILEDFITVVSPDGKVKSSISLLSAFANSSYRPVLDRMPPSGDLFHTNALQILDGSGSKETRHLLPAISWYRCRCLMPSQSSTRHANWWSGACPVNGGFSIHRTCFPTAIF